MPFLRPRAPRPIAILRYCGLRRGGDYASDDRVALAEDLRVIASLGHAIVPLPDVAAFVRGRTTALRDGRYVALSFDEGPDSDWIDEADAPGGLSFRRLLAESGVARTSRRPLAVSFVVAGPEGRTERAEPDGTRVAARGDSWWAQAAEDGVIAIGSCGWSPRQRAVRTPTPRTFTRTPFADLDDFDEAQVQVRGAETYVDAKTGGRSTHLFAWPDGVASDYLLADYMPSQAAIHHVHAAFGLGGIPAAPGADRWNIPRFACGTHWRSPDGLVAILRDARGVPA